MKSVTDINQFRQAKREKIQTLIRTADTGVNPVLVEASNGETYWCKTFANPHGWQSTVNEVVCSVIGETLGAPVIEWQILDIPAGLKNKYTPQSEMGQRINLGELPVFASKNLHNVLDRTTQLSHIDEDSNYDRVPLLVALWFLCNAQDIQFIFDASAQNSVFSLDYGYWFGSEGIEPWYLSTPHELHGRTEIIKPRGQIPSPHWNKAIEAVSALDNSMKRQVRSAVPVEWEVKTEDLDMLVDYALSRKAYTIEELKKLRLFHSRR